MLTKPGLFWMELRTHDVVVGTSEDSDAFARLPIPNTEGLVIRGTDDPWILMVELNSTNLIQMIKQCKDTTAQTSPR